MVNCIKSGREVKEGQKRYVTNIRGSEKIPVLACDQLLFALAKQIQWKHPELYGENKMIIILGGLHVEMAFLKAIGSLLRESGWTDVLVQAGGASTGVADSLLSVSHITRTRHAHQVTVCALFRLMNMAYEQYCMSCNIVGETALSLDEWRVFMSESSPTFHFWILIMELEVLLLVFLTSLRSGDFLLYLQSMTRMAPVFFALDQHNYARWLTVHINDMGNISSNESHEFNKGHFVLKKTARPFSKIALDHAHEQNNAIVKAIQEAGNPFSEKSAEFITLHSKDIVCPAAHKSMKQLMATGDQQFQAFIQDRLLKKTKLLSHPIKKNNLVLISGAKWKKKNASSYKISSLKNDCHLFSRLYIACQIRSGGLDVFFTYENQVTPPSLSSAGKLRSASKASLLECLEAVHRPEENRPAADVIILDGAAVVHIIRPGAAKTFGSNAESVFLPYITEMLLNVDRLDVVFDIYRSDSLKSCTRDNRGVGKRRRVSPETVIPPNWHIFLRNDSNKSELFRYLSQCAITLDTDKQIISTQGSIAVSNSPAELSDLSPCTHEEADSRMMVHLWHAAKDSRRILLRTVDTDVVILAVAAASRHPSHEVWVSMGTGKDLRHIAAH
ncbi:hypothetical protein ACOMHN_042314 [Nucella lapillus]